MMSWIAILLAFAAIASSKGLGEKPMPGGEKTLTDEEIKADEVLQDMESILSQLSDTCNARSNALYAYKITETVKITRKVVAGLEYGVTVKLTPTECKKNKDKYTKEDLKNCQLNAENGRQHTCLFTVWYRPWLILGAPVPLKVDMKKCY